MFIFWCFVSLFDKVPSKLDVIISTIEMLTCVFKYERAKRKWVRNTFYSNEYIEEFNIQQKKNK